MTQNDVKSAIEQAVAKRILILDGAMGTMVQRHQLDEAAFRGGRFANHPKALQGNNDVLVLTQPEIIRGIHTQYLEAGADLIETSTFSSTRIAQADYGLESAVYDLNYQAARLARKAADEWSDRRAVTFDEMVETFEEQVRALVEGGVDLLLPETIIDTLSAKACLVAIHRVFEEKQVELPVMISLTITDRSGRTLSGQTVSAFWTSVAHAKPLSVGINCAFGAREMRPYIAELSRIAPTLISAYPNAGLPDAFGVYNETPEETGGLLGEWAKSGLVNILGGCCGTTPEHIRKIAENARDVEPRRVPPPDRGITHLGSWFSAQRGH